MIQPQEAIDLRLEFRPTEVASYDFELHSDYDHNNNNKNNNNTNNSEVASYLSDKKEAAALTKKASRHSAIHPIPKRKVTALGLRHALSLSDTSINFEIPSAYVDKLKEGGYLETKVIFCCCYCCCRCITSFIHYIFFLT